MMIQGILLPVFVLVAITLAQFFLLNTRSRVPAGGAVTAVDEPLVLSLLFYAVVAVALPLRQADLVMVLLAWVFVVTRLLRAGLLLSGPEGRGGLLDVASALVLLAMWVYFALRILTVL